MIALIVMTDGRRDYLEQTIESFQNLEGPITRRIIHDDSGDAVYRDWMFNAYPDYEPWWSEKRLGFAGAYRSVWKDLQYGAEPYVFSIEDDMVIDRPVDLVAMLAVLEARPHLTQMALRRQAWNDTERTAGGVVETNPTAYQDCSDGDLEWLEHRLFWTTNASLFPRSLTERGWPEGAESEGRFGLDLFSDPTLRAGFWGGRYSTPWITHIGETRAGYGY